MDTDNMTAVCLGVIKRAMMHKIGGRFTQIGKVKAPLCIEHNVIWTPQGLAIAALV